MPDSSFEALHELTRRFYEEAAEEFSETRQAPWEGWSPLAALLAPRGDSLDTLQVLDVGCGNGRFGSFLWEVWKNRLAYCGIDLSQALLDHARKRLPEDAVFIQHDVLTDKLSARLGKGRFDLVALYGVLHHIPGEQRRSDLIRDLASLLRPGGLLACSLWQWKNHPRLSRRIVPWPSKREETVLFPGLDRVDPEKEDYLLRWGRDGQWLRYCHHFTDSEVERLMTCLPLKRVSDTTGEGGLNRYIVLRSPGEGATIAGESL